jgi:XTP/dITP diphosphohydrolase
MKLVFATGNPDKIREVHEILGGAYQLRGLNDIGCPKDLPETSPTILENALQKARFVWENYRVNCFSDDSGLEIDALDGEPGVRSARYAGEEKSPEDNIRLVLSKMRETSNRTARFRAVIALIINGIEYTFEGVVEGVIRHEKSGEGGFGYDPIFQPAGYDITFAEMNSDLKHQISHRGIAVGKLFAFLQGLNA